MSHTAVIFCLLPPRPRGESFLLLPDSGAGDPHRQRGAAGDAGGAVPAARANPDAALGSDAAEDVRGRQVHGACARRAAPRARRVPLEHRIKQKNRLGAKCRRNPKP